VCDGARFTKPALPIHAHSVQIWVAGWMLHRWQLTCGASFLANSCTAPFASLAHEGQQPLAQEPLENRSHIHKRTSSLPQTLRSTVLSMLISSSTGFGSITLAATSKALKWPQHSSQYGGENRRAYSAGRSAALPHASSTPWRHVLRWLNGSSGQVFVF